MMKKHLILLFIAGFFAFSSCSKDDEANNAQHTVVGTWELESTNPPVPGMDPDACPNRPEITFHDNGTVDWTSYSENNDCAAQNDSGTWEKTSATQYSITIPGYGTFVGTVTFETAEQFTFDTTYEGFPVQFNFVK